MKVLKKNEKNRQAWKLRAIQARARLPRPYMVLLIDRYPELDNNQYLQDRIRNMIHGKLVDEEWTKRLEYVAETYKKVS
jgi:hypothetical protein